MSTTILNGIKQFIIENIDPSQLDPNPIEGIRKKEELLKNYTPCALRDSIENYDELEDILNSVYGDRFTDFVLKREFIEPGNPSS